MTVAPPAGTASTEAVPQHRTLVWPVLAGVAVLAGCTAAGIGTLSLASALTATGLPDPGPVTTLGLPFLRAAGEIAAVLAVGSFLFAAFLVPPQPSGVLDADGYRALRLGTVASGVWAVCAALLVPLTLSDVSGHPVADLRPAQMWSLAGLITTASAWRWTAILAAATTLASLPVLRWSWAPVLLAASLTTLIPLGLTGHSSAGGSHDLATNGLLIHLVAAALWAGGLLALLAYALRGGQGGGHLGLATRRFSTIALWCWVAMALSGLVNAAVRVQPSDLLATGYGRLVLAKAAALCLLGGVGWRQRRVNVAALQAVSTLARARRALLRLTLIEAALFGLTFGIAVGLGRTAPPPPPARLPSIAEAEIGYDFDGPPTLTRILFDWRFDLIFGTAAIVLAGLYVAGVVRLRRRGDRWPPGRMSSWLLGCLVLLFVTSSGVGRYMPAMFSMHMVVHMCLSMLVPILLALGAPVTLALRALPAAGRGDPPGPREWLLAALHSRFSRLLTNPVVATVLFVAGFYGLYLSNLFDTTASSHAGHLLMNLHFLLSGYLFYWVVIGVDPTPRPIPPLAKLAVVFASLPLHAFFGVVLMGTRKVLGADYYRSLGFSWHTDLLGDQRLGGGIAWSAGEFPLVIVMLALLVQWARSDRRTAKRLDRAADRDDDAELAAYNAMLAQLAGRDKPGEGSATGQA
ncbi:MULTISPECIES: bifunctional copper resistance protein CopD/cytochrome c oxidase assembly protein [Mycobacterium avium complex (MAC)]|uniref:bifunctional copper resistance protein CopD/cytochrome c oxidase assembly protein n=1 Tax=Mycobacterium avium complex (MAC) TaxID=120793 RepID=UPI000449AE2B|nr:MULTISPECIES: bifunctional copper resistance protein CopD/cytochrome c oxidase assembly protein [Mycobacterium avium complex (MAC)]ETZ84780.1 copper resistance D family protein [Mycobacterium sp. MAC_011194_8550]MBZ4505506.1 bifunctional copper resistance protein CopD/cytochrome c oxidase assembly protein [Mycobacterium avium subsp. hominissuis]MBZ4518039.1 bifunctional copper resistance protein CopD/cytochrome c oxidase assembly protein [Mycobacterium avium subsp. hominissuis]MBZ4527839.1 b